MNRKVLIRKLAHPPPATAGKRRPRGALYGVDVVTALAKVREIFDYPCGQRLAPALRSEVARLRQVKELRCSDEVAGKLSAISPSPDFSPTH